MGKYRALVEQQIAKAHASGGLLGLEGAGNPLPDRPVEISAQLAMSAGMRIMAEAGVLPEEFVLIRERDAARAACATDTAEDKTSAIAKLADMECGTISPEQRAKKLMC